MIAVGIDVSKSKSTVAILNGDGSIRAKPFDVHHVADELQELVDYIKRTSEPPTILMEPTSHYHYPLLKAFQEACLAHLTDHIERLETLNETQKHAVVGIPAFKRKNGRNARHCFIQKAEQLNFVNS